MTKKTDYFRKPILIACLAFATAQGIAQSIWVEDDKNNLFTIDAKNNLSFVATIWGTDLAIPVSGTKASTVALDFKTQQITDIAFIGNQLYGITPGSLYSIDQKTGAASFVMNLGNDAATRPFTSLAYDPNTNKLLAADDPKNTALGIVPGQLFTIDVATKSISSVNPDPTGAGACSSQRRITTCTSDTNAAFRSSGDLAFVGGQLFLSSNTPTADTLVTLVNGQGPLATGQASPMLALNGSAVPEVWGLATVGNTLYGLAGQSLYTVSTSGAMMLQTTFSNATDGVSQFNGATVGPDMVSGVPEPSTYALFLAGLGVMGMLARRRLPKQGLSIIAGAAIAARLKRTPR